MSTNYRCYIATETKDSKEVHMKGFVKATLFGAGVGFGLVGGAVVFLYGIHIGWMAKENADKGDQNAMDVKVALDDTDRKLADIARDAEAAEIFN